MQKTVDSVPQQPEDLLTIIGRFVNADTWDEAQRLVEEHPALLGPETAAILSELIASLDDANERRAVERHRELLHRCHTVGVAQAFAEYETANQSPLQAAMQALLETTSWEATQRIIESRPELLDAKVDSLLEQVIDFARERADEGSVQVFEEYRLLLRRCREVGIAPAFAERKRALASPLQPTMRAFLQADTWAETQQVVERHPELLSAEADDLLAELAAAQYDHNTRQMVEEHRSLLRLCQVIGVAQAFAQKIHEHNDIPDEVRDDLHLGTAAAQHELRVDDPGTTDQGLPPPARPEAELPFLQVLAALPPEQQNILIDMVHNADSPAAFNAALNAHPELRDALEQAVAAHGLIPPAFQAALQRVQEAERRYQQTARRDTLDEVVAAWEMILQHPSFATAELDFCLLALNYAGGAYFRRYWDTGQLTDLNQALACLQREVELTPAGSPGLPSRLNDLGTALSDRYIQTGRPSDLEQAITACKQAIELTPEGSPDLPNRLSNLGTGLRDRYMLTGVLGDLEQAITAYEQAVTLTPAGSPNLPACLNNLGLGLRDCYARTGALPDLERAITAYERAVELTPAGSPNVPRHLNNLGNGLSDRYARTGTLLDLERAITVYERAVALTSEGSPDAPGYLSNLGTGLRDRYARTGVLPDLERAITAYERAVALTPEGSPNLPSYFNNLGLGLRNRYLRTGALGDLERAITVYEQAVERTLEGSPDAPSYFNNLGLGLRDRYARTGERTDLERAITAYERAIALTPEDSPDAPGYFNNLGLGLRDRYARTRERTDLEQAITAYERAVALTSEGSPHLPAYLSNLGTGLRTRYARTGALGDLERAITAYEQAVERTPEGSPHLPRYLNNLGTGLSDRYARTGAWADLERAITAYEQAVTLIPEGSPDLPGFLSNLGAGLRTRYARTGALGDLEQAITAYERACVEGLDVAPEVVLTSSRTWGAWAMERAAWGEAAHAYAFGMRASDSLVRLQLLRLGKEDWLHEAQELHSRAAYALAKSGDLQGAVVAFERGRARLMAETLERDRTDLEAILPQYPELYTRYWQAAERVTRVEREDLRPESLPPGFDLVAEARAARTELEVVTESIRHVPGYENFLKSSTYTDIQQAAQSAPLIYIVATSAGGVSLIVSPSGETTALWLDTLTDKALRERVLGPRDAPHFGGYLGAYALWQQHRDDDMAGTAWRAALEKITQWLWDVLMKPLVETLTRDGRACATLIPAGILGLLPLHAARTADTHAPTGYRYALDTLAFTYAPNARALLAARASATSITPDAIFAIENPDGSLDFSSGEIDTALSSFPPGCKKVQGGEGATRQAVLEHISHYPVLHFCTHGQAGWATPLDGGLLLAHGEFLTLRDLLGLRLGKTRLAILSACETSVPGTRLLDEVESLPTGLVQAGVAGVIGSLWAVRDASTMLLLTRFYALWRREGRSPVEALRQAQIWLRDTMNAEKQTYFRAMLPEPRSEPLGAAAAYAAYWHLALLEPEGRDYAHPAAWAACGYTGV